jgi:GH24 family phage-related lysozyme (muramidase)
MKLCILNSETKVCENIVSADTIESFIPYKEGIEISPDHDGEIGWIWSGDGWITNEVIPTIEELEARARHKRNNLLKQTVDRINPLRWEYMTQEQKDAWISYRQTLLDVPQQQGFPINVQWPVKPE